MTIFESQKVSYSEILKLRRSARCQMSFDDLVANEQWRLKINNGQFRYYAEIDKDTDPASEGFDFVNFRQPFCNAPVKTNEIARNTHDFCNSGSWIGGASNSFYGFFPLYGKLFIPKTFITTSDAELEISSPLVGQFVQTADGVTVIPGRGFVIDSPSNDLNSCEILDNNESKFQAGDKVIHKHYVNGLPVLELNRTVSSIDSQNPNLIHFDANISPAPAAGDVIIRWQEIRPEDEPEFDGVTVLTGWRKVDPISPGSPDEHEVWFHFTNGVHDYQLTRFRYESLSSIRSKADERYSSPNHDYAEEPLVGEEAPREELNLFYKYRETGVDVSFVYSLNEQMQFYIENHQPYATVAGMPAFATIKMDSLTEW